MKYKNITCIINPSSGKDTPILGAINEAVQKSHQPWNIHVTQKPGDIEQYVKDGLNAGTDLFIIYGGDGSVMEAARTLVSKQIPLLVLPGGTANVISKELALPQNCADILKLLLEDKLFIQSIDVGQLNDIPFLLRVNFGLLGDMVKETSSQTKQNYGQLAYGLTVASQLQKAQLKQYTIFIDEQEMSLDAVGLMVTNMGNIGIGNLSIHPNVATTDGLLDIVVIQNSNLSSIVSLAASTLTQSENTDNLKHYQAKHIMITPKEKESVICDDEEIQYDSYNFTVLPKALQLLSGISQTAI